jgi:hypothetical protein
MIKNNRTKKSTTKQPLKKLPSPPQKKQPARTNVLTKKQPRKPAKKVLLGTATALAAKTASAKPQKRIDPSEAVLDDDATPADATWAGFSEEEFLKGEKGGKKRAADDHEEEKDEEDDEDDLDGFGIDEEE